MSYLIAGYERLAAEEEAALAAACRIDPLPPSPALAAGAVQVVADAAAAAAWAARLRALPVSQLGVHAEYAPCRPPVTLRDGSPFRDVHGLRPLACAVAAWCGPEAGGDLVVRLVFDLRRPEVYPGLQDLFGLHVPWATHGGRDALHCLWACGVEPAEHLLGDTYVTARCLRLGLAARDRRPATAPEEIDRRRRQREEEDRATGLPAQCRHYDLPYPYEGDADGILRNSFQALGLGDPLDAPRAEFAAAGAEFALRLHLAQQADVQRSGLAHHLAQLEWPLVGVVARMEREGLPVNPDRREHYRQLCLQIAQEMGRRLRVLGVEPGSIESFLRAAERAGVLGHFLRGGEPHADDDTLREAEKQNVHPAARPFRLHRYFQRLASDPFLSGALLSADGRQRGTLESVGTVTGRVTSARPALAGLDSRLRPLVEAQPGMVLVEVDYEQVEVGVAAAEYEDEELIRQYNRGDVYAGAAQAFYAAELTEAERGLSLQEFEKARPDLRRQAKVLFLGVLHGEGAARVAEDFGCPLAQAEAELRRFRERFPRAWAGAERAADEALRRGHALAVTGLRRLVGPGDGGRRNALRNHPVQGSAAAIFKAALLRIDGYYRGTETKLLLPRHDSVLLLTPEGTVSQVIATCRTLMALAMREKYHRLEPRVTAEAGKTWPTDQTLEAYCRKEFGDGHEGPPPPGE